MLGLLSYQDTETEMDTWVYFKMVLKILDYIVQVDLQQLESKYIVHFFAKWWQKESSSPASEWNIEALFRNESPKTIAKKLRRW